MSRDPFAPIEGAGATSAKPRRQALTIVLPVPVDAPAAPSSHYKLGKPSKSWTYADASGATLGYVCRFDRRDGEKEFRPLTLWRPAGGGPATWRWESWPLKRPLYGLQLLAERPSAPVVICEGEKAADAAAALLPGFVAVASPNGSQSAHKADWSPLRRRRVTIWPDADLAGAQYADAAAKQVAAVHAISVAIVDPPDGFIIVATPPGENDKREIDWTALRDRRVIIWPDGNGAYADAIAKLIAAAGAELVAITPRPQDGIAGWDAADALTHGWTSERAAALEAAAAQISIGTVAEDRVSTANDRRRRTPQRDTLIGLTEACEFWHDTDRAAYVTFDVNSRREHWPVRSRDFRMWLSGRYYAATDSRDYRKCAG